MSDDDTEERFPDQPGVPRGEGESWAELSERLSPDATADLSCPNGCFELTVTARHAAGGADDLIDRAIVDEPGPCPNCGAER